MQRRDSRQWNRLVVGPARAFARPRAPLGSLQIFFDVGGKGLGESCTVTDHVPLAIIFYEGTLQLRRHAAAVLALKKVNIRLVAGLPVAAREPDSLSHARGYLNMVRGGELPMRARRRPRESKAV